MSRRNHGPEVPGLRSGCKTGTAILRQLRSVPPKSTDEEPLVCTDCGAEVEDEGHRFCTNYGSELRTGMALVLSCSIAPGDERIRSIRQLPSSVTAMGSPLPTCAKRLHVALSEVIPRSSDRVPGASSTHPTASRSEG